MNGAGDHAALKRPLVFDDMRLTRLMLTDPRRCASVNEYASATGIAVPRILSLLAPALGAGQLELEAAGGDVFVHTAPGGRDGAVLPANLWESLRSGRDQDTAFALWRLVRGLEQGGWKVESDPATIPVIDQHTTFLALRLGETSMVPLLVLPEPGELAAPSSPLQRYEDAGLRAVAVACRNRELDAIATSVRRWLLAREGRSPLHVLLLEAPHYQPVLLGGADTAVAPRAVTQLNIEELTRGYEPRERR